FFADLGIDIDQEFPEGSKANRLRAFLRSSDAPRVAQALEALLEHRGTRDGDDASTNIVKVKNLIARLRKAQVATQAASSTLAGKSIARLVLAQDTGAAIVGPGRVDLFVGSGEEARVAAAHTSYPGELFLLLPRRSRR
nr:hypothetical protein [Deltaproteobacteria bacterium]